MRYKIWQLKTVLPLLLAVIMILSLVSGILPAQKAFAADDSLRIKISPVYDNGLLFLSCSLGSGGNILTVTNRANYWVGFHVDGKVGNIDLVPNDEKTKVLNSLGILPPQESLSFIVDTITPGAGLTITAQASDFWAQFFNSVFPLLKIFIGNAADLNNWELVLGLMDIPTFYSLGENIISAAAAFKADNDLKGWGLAKDAALDLFSLVNNPDNRAALVSTLVEKGIVKEVEPY
jgi:hypothetical protein